MPAGSNQPHLILAREPSLKRQCRRQIDKWTALPLSIRQSSRRRLHERASNFWTFTMSNSKAQPRTRAITGAHALEIRIPFVVLSSCGSCVPLACVAEGRDPPPVNLVVSSPCPGLLVRTPCKFSAHERRPHQSPRRLNDGAAAVWTLTCAYNERMASSNDHASCGRLRLKNQERRAQNLFMNAISETKNRPRQPKLTRAR